MYAYFKLLILCTSPRILRSENKIVAFTPPLCVDSSKSHKPKPWISLGIAGKLSNRQTESIADASNLSRCFITGAVNKTCSCLCYFIQLNVTSCVKIAAALLLIYLIHGSNQKKHKIVAAFLSSVKWLLFPIRGSASLNFLKYSIPEKTHKYDSDQDLVWCKTRGNKYLLEVHPQDIPLRAKLHWFDKQNAY